MVLGAVLIRDDSLSTWLLLSGVGLVALVLVGPNLKVFKLSKDGFQVEQFDREEGEVAREIARPDAEIEAFSDKIDSDDESAPRTSVLDSEIIGGLNYAAGEIALDAILRNAVETRPGLQGCKLHVFLFDESAGVLYAATGTHPTETVWEPGRGATGTAYDRRHFVLAAGLDASDDTYGLTAEQQDLYRDLTAVASAPIFNSAGDILGVLTATTTEEDPALTGDHGEVDLVATSLLASRVLIELLQWFDDGRRGLSG